MNNFPYRIFAKYTGYDYDITRGEAWYILIGEDLDQEYPVLRKAGTFQDVGLDELEIIEHPFNDAVIMNKINKR